MVLDAVSNFVRGNTDAAVGTDDTTVSVDDASIFPDPETDGEFNVVIWDVNNFPRPDQDGDVEIMRVTARDTDTNELTVTRAQELTSAATHPEGSAIHLSPTAKMFSDIESTFDDFWDAGAQELTADVNNTNTTTTSLEAEGLDIERSTSDATTETLSQATAEAPNQGANAGVLTQSTEDVSTTETEILDLSDADPSARNAVGFVDGIEQENSANRFVDLLLFYRDGGVTVIDSDSNSSPASRTYSRGIDGSLSYGLEMGENTYDVAATVYIGGLIP